MEIVIGIERWVVIGRTGWDPDTDELVLSDCATIRRWGTSNGIGQLRKGPTTETVLDYEGTARIPRGAVVRRIEVSEEAWAPVLEGLR